MLTFETLMAAAGLDPVESEELGYFIHEALHEAGTPMLEHDPSEWIDQLFQLCTDPMQLN